MPENFEITPGRLGDLLLLVESFDQAEYFTDRASRSRRGAGDLLVAWLDGRPVGTVNLWREQPERADLAEIPRVEGLEVLPAQRRRGIGSALLTEAERLAHSRGNYLVYAAVSTDQPELRDMFATRGYDDWGHGSVALSGQPHAVLLKSVEPGGAHRWDAWHPTEAAARLAGCPVRWAVAGGWAIDLHVGRVTRDHSDLEIAISRCAFDRFRPYLDGFDLYDVGSGQVRRLGPGQQPHPDHHQVRVCDAAIPAWRMDTILEPGDADTWVSHRDHRVRASMRHAVLSTGDGIPYLAPQIVLFTKANHARAKDQADLAVALPTLDQGSAEWLYDAIALVHPGHPWLSAIKR